MTNIQLFSKLIPQRETTLLVRLNDLKYHDSHWHIRDVDIEEVVLAYMGQKRNIADVKAMKGGHK